jgi:hypothetical protein
MSAEDDRPEGQPLLPEFGKVLPVWQLAVVVQRGAERRSSGVKLRFLIQSIDSEPGTGGRCRPEGQHREEQKRAKGRGGRYAGGR